MNAFGKLAIIQTKLYLREPLSVFFTLFFGPIYLVLMGLIFGNAPQELFGGRGQLDIQVPAFMALVIGVTGLTAVPIGAATRRETGVLRRFSATPLRPLTYFLADVLAPFLLTLAGVLFLILLGFVLFQVRFSGNWLSLAGGVLLCTASFFALGYAIAGLVPNSRTAVILGNVVLIPLVIFSGITVPLEVMPEAVRSVARFDPLAHVAALLRGLWLGEAWGDHLLEVIVLGAILAVGVAIVALTFKWE